MRVKITAEEYEAWIASIAARKAVGGEPPCGVDVERCNSISGTPCGTSDVGTDYALPSSSPVPSTSAGFSEVTRCLASSNSFDAFPNASAIVGPNEDIDKLLNTCLEGIDFSYLFSKEECKDVPTLEMLLGFNKIHEINRNSPMFSPEPDSSLQGIEIPEDIDLTSDTESAVPDFRSLLPPHLSPQNFEAPGTGANSQPKASSPPLLEQELMMIMGDDNYDDEIFSFSPGSSPLGVMVDPEKVVPLGTPFEEDAAVPELEEKEKEGNAAAPNENSIPPTSSAEVGLSASVADSSQNAQEIPIYDITLSPFSDSSPKNESKGVDNSVASAPASVHTIDLEEEDLEESSGQSSSPSPPPLLQSEESNPEISHLPTLISPTQLESLWSTYKDETGEHDGVHLPSFHEIALHRRYPRSLFKVKQVANDAITYIVEDDEGSPKTPSTPEFTNTVELDSSPVNRTKGKENEEKEVGDKEENVEVINIEESPPPAEKQSLLTALLLQPKNKQIQFPSSLSKSFASRTTSLSMSLFSRQVQTTNSVQNPIMAYQPTVNFPAASFTSSSLPSLHQSPCPSPMMMAFQRPAMGADFIRPNAPVNNRRKMSSASLDSVFKVPTFPAKNVRPKGRPRNVGARTKRQVGALRMPPPELQLESNQQQPMWQMTSPHQQMSGGQLSYGMPTQSSSQFSPLPFPQYTGNSNAFQQQIQQRNPYQQSYQSQYNSLISNPYQLTQQRQRLQMQQNQFKAAYNNPILNQALQVPTSQAMSGLPQVPPPSPTPFAQGELSANAPQLLQNSVGQSVMPIPAYPNRSPSVQPMPIVSASNQGQAGIPSRPLNSILNDRSLSTPIPTSQGMSTPFQRPAPSQTPLPSPGMQPMQQSPFSPQANPYSPNFRAMRTSIMQGLANPTTPVLSQSSDQLSPMSPFPLNSPQALSDSSMQTSPQLSPGPYAQSAPPSPLLSQYGSMMGPAAPQPDRGGTPFPFPPRTSSSFNGFRQPANTMQQNPMSPLSTLPRSQSRQSNPYPEQTDSNSINTPTGINSGGADNPFLTQRSKYDLALQAERLKAQQKHLEMRQQQARMKLLREQEQMRLSQQQQQFPQQNQVPYQNPMGQPFPFANNEMMNQNNPSFAQGQQYQFPLSGVPNFGNAAASNSMDYSPSFPQQQFQQQNMNNVPQFASYPNQQQSGDNQAQQLSSPSRAYPPPPYHLAIANQNPNRGTFTNSDSDGNPFSFGQSGNNLNSFSSNTLASGRQTPAVNLQNPSVSGRQSASLFPMNTNTNNVMPTTQQQNTNLGGGFQAPVYNMTGGSYSIPAETVQNKANENLQSHGTGSVGNLQNKMQNPHKDPFLNQNTAKPPQQRTHPVHNPVHQNIQTTTPKAPTQNVVHQAHHPHKTHHLPHHRGDNPYYSQSELDAHHHRVVENNPTSKDSDFENEGKYLDWYLSEAAQTLHSNQMQDEEEAALKRNDAIVPIKNTTQQFPITVHHYPSDHPALQGNNRDLSKGSPGSPNSASSSSPPNSPSRHKRLTWD